MGAEGVNRIWRDAKLRGAGMKRAKTLVSAAEHSVGSKEAPEAARLELRNLLNDMDVYASRVEKLLGMIEEKLKEIPYIDKLMAIKGVGLITVSGFIAEVGDIRRIRDCSERIREAQRRKPDQLQGAETPEICAV